MRRLLVPLGVGPRWARVLGVAVGVGVVWGAEGLGTPASGASPQPAVAAGTTTATTVEELVTAVVRDNPELAFYRAEVAAAQAGRRTAAQWSNPELNFELGHKRSWERRGPPAGDGMAWSVAVAQPVEFPGRIALRKAIANQEVELAQLGLEQFQAGLAARARTLSYRLIGAQVRVDAAAEVAGRFRALAEVLVQRDPAGVTPLLDLRIIEASGLIAARRVTEAERERQSALLELNQLRGAAPATALRLTGAKVETPPLPPLTTLLEAARNRNFELRLRQAELKQQGFQVDLKRNERWPTITLAPFVSRETAADEERIVGIGVSAPLPLWHRNGGAIEAAEARVQQAEAGLRSAYRQVEREVTDRTLAYQAQLDAMTTWQTDAEVRFREAAELADRHYRLGAVPVATYVEMQTRYLEALETVRATRQEALEHRYQLELLLGASWAELQVAGEEAR